MAFAATMLSAGIVSAQVVNATADFAADRITINGENFNTKKPTVKLNGIVLGVISSDPTNIVASLQNVPDLQPGGYLLEVAGRKGWWFLTVTVGSSGPLGPPGPVGAVGPAGPVGPVGPQGQAGLVGAIGPEGPAGAPGAAGPEGQAGPAGATGPGGPVGPAGAIGPEGQPGAVGPMGPQGATGPAGAVGPEGPTGAMGAEGPAGAMGPEGPAGPAGPVGPVGSSGPIGPVGPVGPAGPVGAAGPEGPAGPQGPSGAQGEIGPQGPQGVPGLPGGAGAVVVDANGEAVGVFELSEASLSGPTVRFFSNDGPDLVVFQTDGTGRFLGYPDARLFFQSPDCSGQAYVRSVGTTGRHVWATAGQLGDFYRQIEDDTYITVSSQMSSGICQELGQPLQGSYALAGPLTLANFVEPLRIELRY